MEVTPELITQFGLMQKISTGNSYLDMLLCLLVPLLIRKLFPTVQEWVQKYFKPTAQVEENAYSRVITYESRSEYYYTEGPENSILQTAVMNHINRLYAILRNLPVAEYRLKYKELEQTDSGNDSDSDDETPRDIYAVNLVPPDNELIDLQNGIKFTRSVEKPDEKTTKFKFVLQSSEADGADRIQNFIQKALDIYTKAQAGRVDHSRYMFVPILNTFGRRVEGADKITAMYKRYKLSEEKSFKSFFHPDKPSILQLVDHFVNKTGKFSIPGYPQKLGFLLYGPPGTGKTSFIKALAQYTKRNIVSIPLNKIRTNQDLMNLMYDQHIQLDNDAGNQSMGFKKVIFVMEDVDAASHVVLRRAELDASAYKPKPVITAITNSPIDKADDKADDKATDVGTIADEPLIGPAMPVMLSRHLGIGSDDSLNLAGLLNALDGVVDAPGRLVIMTTNHPEKLDPALIRPGRINKKIYLGFMKLDQATAMIRHYFGDLPEAAEQQLRDSFVEGVMAPAELESMCAEYDSVEQLVAALDTRCKHPAPVRIIEQVMEKKEEGDEKEGGEDKSEEETKESADSDKKEEEEEEAGESAATAAEPTAAVAPLGGPTRWAVDVVLHNCTHCAFKPRESAGSGDASTCPLHTPAPAPAPTPTPTDDSTALISAITTIAATAAAKAADEADAASAAPPCHVTGDESAVSSTVVCPATPAVCGGNSPFTNVEAGSEVGDASGSETGNDTATASEFEVDACIEVVTQHPRQLKEGLEAEE